MNLFEKLNLFLKTIRILRNWYIFPLVYFRLIKKPYVIFLTRDNLRIKIILDSNNYYFHVFVEQFLQKPYSENNFEIRDNPNIIDVGANIGFFSLLMSKKYPDASIYSFEPNPDNYNFLIECIKDNQQKNIHPYNYAVSSKNGKVTLYTSIDNFAGHSLYARMVGYNERSLYVKTENKIQVQSITLDTIFNDNKIEKCDMLKLDCEGAEYEILMNSDESLKKIENISLEYHNFNLQNFSIDDIIKKLKNFGFSVSVKPYIWKKNNGIIFAWKKNQQYSENS